MPIIEPLLPGALVGIAVAIVGALFTRAIRGLDKKLDALDSHLMEQDRKFDVLRDKDGTLEVQMAEMRVRLVHVEATMMMMQRRRIKEEVD
jgi:hypothetical protein